LAAGEAGRDLGVCVLGSSPIWWLLLLLLQPTSAQERGVLQLLLISVPAPSTSITTVL